MILTHRYRLPPQKGQHRALERLCASQRELYNAALEERIDCYRKTGKTRTYIDQCKALTACRRELPDMGELPLNLQRWTLKRLDEAFQGFFRRLKARSGKAGFPRFRGKERWEAFGFNEFSGIRLMASGCVLQACPEGSKCICTGSCPKMQIFDHEPDRFMGRDARVLSPPERRKGGSFST